MQNGVKRVSFHRLSDMTKHVCRFGGGARRISQERSVQEGRLPVLNEGRERKEAGSCRRPPDYNANPVWCIDGIIRYRRH